MALLRIPEESNLTVATGPQDVADHGESSSDLVERAIALRPVLRANSPHSDTERRLADEVVAAMQAAGLLQVCIPRRYGGYQADFTTLFNLTTEIARGDGSAAWVCALINSGAWMVGTYPRQAQDDVWRDAPYTRIATVLQQTTSVSRRVNGGYVISGTWPYGSGSLHAQWANLGFIVDDGGEPSQVLGLVPMSELSIEDTWYVAGMRGSGSNTIVGNDVFVADHRIQHFRDLAVDRFATELVDEVEYRAPFVPIAGLVLAAPQIGLTTAALDLTLEKLPGRAVTYTKYTHGSDSPTNQIGVAEAANAIDIARLVAHRACADIDNAARTSEPLDVRTRARIRMDTATAITMSRNAINTLLSVNGADSFATVNPLQQIWRDSETASRHALINPEIAREIYGKALLGVDDMVMPI